SENLDDLVRIGARRDDPVVFEPALGAVVHQVDAGIHVDVTDLAVVRNVREPLAGIFADQVVALARQRVFPDDLWIVAGTQKRLGDLRRDLPWSAGRARRQQRLAQAKDRLLAPEEEVIPPAAHSELGRIVELALVLLE